jgi:ribonuclease P protein component
MKKVKKKDNNIKINNNQWLYDKKFIWKKEDISKTLNTINKRDHFLEIKGEGNYIFSQNFSLLYLIKPHRLEKIRDSIKNKINDNVINMEVDESYHLKSLKTLHKKEKNWEDSIKEPLFAFITPKKIGDAFIRNKCRRRFRDCLRSINFTLQPGLYSFNIKKQVYYTDFSSMREELKSFLKKIV